MNLEQRVAQLESVVRGLVLHAASETYMFHRERGKQHAQAVEYVMNSTQVLLRSLPEQDRQSVLDDVGRLLTL